MNIRIEDLSVGYGQQAVINALSLSIEEGSFFTLLGPSGCGKTTLLRCLAGFVQVNAGRVFFGQQNVTQLPAHRRNVGMVFQDYALFPDKSVFDNIAYGLRARKQDGASVTRKVGAALEQVGLQGLAQRLPAALSGGQRQRVALARALVIEPQVLLMDEPLSNLDAKLRLQVRQTIAELQAKAGITTVFVTHDQDEALALSHRIGVMNQGRLEQVGTPAQIYREPASVYVADFVGAANVLPVLLAQDCGAGASTRVRLTSAADVVISGTAGAPLRAGPAHLVLRPEDIHIGRADADANAGLTHDMSQTVIPGQVRARQYLGDKTLYKVALNDVQMLDVSCHGAAHDAHAPGEPVRLTLLAGRCRVLPS